MLLATSFGEAGRVGMRDFRREGVVGEVVGELLGGWRVRSGGRVGSGGEGWSGAGLQRLGVFLDGLAAARLLDCGLRGGGVGGAVEGGDLRVFGQLALVAGQVLFDHEFELVFLGFGVSVVRRARAGC